MQLVVRVLLVLSLAMLLHATTTKIKVVRVKLDQGPGLKGRTVKMILDPSVQPEFISTSDSTTANMSLSPWTYWESHNDSRMPSRISQAQCLTSHCLSLQGGGEDAALQAKPIQYQVLVLYKVKRSRPNKEGRRKARKQNIFRLGTEVITVGCTCVRPSVIPQQ